MSTQTVSYLTSGQLSESRKDTMEIVLSTSKVRVSFHMAVTSRSLRLSFDMAKIEELSSTPDLIQQPPLNIRPESGGRFQGIGKFIQSLISTSGSPGKKTDTSTDKTSDTTKPK